MSVCSGKLLFFFIIISIFINKLVLSSNKDEDFSSAIIFIGNSTTGISVYRQYEISVSSVLSSLALESDPQIPGFFVTSAGSSRNKAYGSYICWGYVSPKLCQKCVNYATQALSKQEIYQECFADGYYLDSNLCLVNYANQSVIDEYMGNAMSTASVGKKAANRLAYNKTLSTTIEGLIIEAGYGNWSRSNLATRLVPVPGSKDKIHILVQCIPVMSAKNCSTCLRELYHYVLTTCNGTEGGVGVCAGCIIKFNNRSFVGGGAYGSTTPSYLHIILVIMFSFYIVICI